MAGNLVKWWRHKILGGYKQFSGRLLADFKKILFNLAKLIIHRSDRDLVCDKLSDHKQYLLCIKKY